MRSDHYIQQANTRRGLHCRENGLVFRFQLVVLRTCQYALREIELWVQVYEKGFFRFEAVEDAHNVGRKCGLTHAPLHVQHSDYLSVRHRNTAPSENIAAPTG